MLALELLEELERLRPLAQDRELPFDRREVARGEQRQARKAGADGRVERVRVAVERLGDEHALALPRVQRQETQLERESTQRGLVDAIEQVRGADEYAVEALHPPEPP